MTDKSTTGLINIFATNDPAFTTKVHLVLIVFFPQDTGNFVTIRSYNVAMQLLEGKFGLRGNKKACFQVNASLNPWPLSIDEFETPFVT